MYFVRLLFGVLIWLGLLVGSPLCAQNKAELYGTVRNAVDQKGIEYVTVYVKGTTTAVETDANGAYRLYVSPNQALQVVYARLGYKEVSYTVEALSSGYRKKIDVLMPQSDSDIEVVVTESKAEHYGMIRQDVSALKLLPGTSGNLESILPHIALGTNSGTGGELSSQYNVRGGNYDENLVYVNDFEIYRPQLISNAAQEGLSFPNMDLIRSLSFSSGGFQAKYGDKMSSVLDIHYKRPDSTAASVSLSTLGGAAHVEGAVPLASSSYRRFRYLAGVRYKNNQLLLNSLDIEGEYQPSFTDIQSYLTYDLTNELQLGFLANYNRSIYRLIPKQRNTALGLISFSLRLNAEFEGQEWDDFRTAMGGLSLTYLPKREKNPLFLKLLVSGFQSDEQLNFDIRGSYRLSQIETSIGAENQGDELILLGQGVQHQFSRALFSGNVSSVRLKGGKEWNRQLGEMLSYENHFLEWGVSYQNEIIQDRINEWERLDSAGYSLPYDANVVQLVGVLKSQNRISSRRYAAYVQNSYTRFVSGRYEWKINSGIRTQFWSLNGELLISPRIQFLYKPLRTARDISYRFSTGLYAQPAFYRELRRLDGSLNTKLKAQKSLHFVAGLQYDFLLGKLSPKKFRLISELYYKSLWNLVSYDVENVRILYSGENDASGSVMGWDVRLNGEFVPGVESWVNLSFLRARENLLDVQHKRRNLGQAEGVEVNDVPRPTDRFFNLNVFFQDQLPSNDHIKVHVNIAVGSGLPFGLKNNNLVYRNSFRFAPYRRVDIGFSAKLWDSDWALEKPYHPLRFARSTWLSLEIFNLLKVQNVASNTWIKTFTGTQFAVPNELTSRRLNLRLRVEF